MNTPQGIEQNLAWHSLDEITARAGFESLVDVLISSICSKYDKACIRKVCANPSNARYSTHPLQAKIHYGQIGSVLSKERDRVFPAPSLCHNRHVRLGIDNRADADPYNRMIVDHKYLNLRGGFDPHR
jgi:hypothetical protein